MNPGSPRNDGVPKTDSEIPHLPNEILECILLKLSYAEITRMRQVCRRFRDFGDEILNGEFLYINTGVKSHEASLAQENNSPFSERPSQISSRDLLYMICCKIRLLRAVCYRPLFLSEVPQDTRLSSAYFKGNIIDVTNRILRLLRSRWVEKSRGSGSP
jgi:hypothetical protein